MNELIDAHTGIGAESILINRLYCRDARGVKAVPGRSRNCGSYLLDAPQQGAVHQEDGERVSMLKVSDQV